MGVPNFPGPPTNVVTPTADADRPALADWRGHSEYASRSLVALPGELTRILEGMPVEDVDIATRYQATESHVMGTVVMGRDPAASVVDADLRHHTLRKKFDDAVLDAYAADLAKKGVRPTRAVARTQFLLSTTFFALGGDESKPLSYRQLYDPYVNPCYNPVL